MGRQFKLINGTKRHTIKNPRTQWTGEPFCECYQVMHKYHWDKTDDICSVAYDSYYKFTYDPDNDEMEHVDILNELLNGGNLEDNRPKQNIQPTPHQKFYYSDEENIMLRHVPDWDGDICRTCANLS